MQISEVTKIEDPAQRLVALIVYQAIKDALFPPSESVRLDAVAFLENYGGAYDKFVDYDILKIYELAKEYHEGNSHRTEK